MLTSRNPALGQKAADDLKAEGLDSVTYKQLDIGDPASVEVGMLKQGGLGENVRRWTFLCLCPCFYSYCELGLFGSAKKNHEQV